ncbi:hypothetical protein DITRI_Ditri15bG0101000 [Diplodiscus trichospermus]
MAEINHFLHWDPLVLTEEGEINDEVVCLGCRNRLACPFYGCRYCNFYLHKSCAELPEEIHNFFHPCLLVLHILPYRYVCNACFKDGSGFSYCCRRCNFDMHLKCTQRPTMKSEGGEVIHHFTHWHPLTLVDQERHLQVRCCICEKLCPDSSDSSAYGCQECNFFLHNSCMINIPQQINHFFHPTCPLILLTTVPYSCDGCNEYSSGLAFRCGKCHFQLDVKCALLPTVESKGADKIQHYSHEHPLTLRESKEFDNEVRCRACGENCSGPCFVCEYCNFFLHRRCAVEFPREIHHPFHPLHPLTLTPLEPSTFECGACGGCDDRLLLSYRCVKYDELIIFYCDDCKEKICKFESVYYCEEYKFIAEIRCLLPSLTTSSDNITLHSKPISKDDSAFKAAISEINNEIVVLTAKKKPLEAEIEKHRAMLQKLEEEIKPTKE